MSYCVNCGVELAPSERVCPLCHTEVVNPKQPYDKEAPKPYPSQMDVFMPRDDRGFVAVIISFILMLPAAICLACDVTYTSAAGWSILVVGAAAMLWIFIVPMLFIRHYRVLVATILDSGALLGYLWVVQRSTGSGRWLSSLALPVVLLAVVLLIVDYLLCTKVISGRLNKAAAIIATMPLLLIGLEVSLDRYMADPVSLLWSYIVSIPCLILALLLVVVDRRKRLKETMRKRLHM